jgi:dipeptidyl aminopeptidase/acylaminoacyl peptidase
MKPITSEDFVLLKFPNSPTLSPDGRKLIFSIKKIDQKENKYLAPLYLKIEGENECIQFTSGTHFDTTPKFSPSGEFVAFLSSRAKKAFQVFIMPIDGGEAIQITNFPIGVLGFTWSHDSNSILILARVNQDELTKLIQSQKDKPPSFVLKPEEYKAYKSREKQREEMKKDPRIIEDAYYREGTAYLDGRFAQPFLISVKDFNKNIENHKQHNIVHLGEFGFHFSLGTFSLDDTSIYLSKVKGDPTLTIKHEVLRISTSDPSDITVLGEISGRVADNFHVSPDGKYLSFEAIRDENNIYDNVHIFLFDFELSQPGTFICITEDYNRSAEQSRWIDKDNLVFISPSNGKINIHKVALKSKEVLPVVTGDRNINSFAISQNGVRIAFEVSHRTFPSDIFWCNADGSAEERITEANREYLQEHMIADIESFTYERDGVELQGWLLLPPDKKPYDKLPVVLEVHGGPAVMWSPHEKTLWHEWNTLVSKGYAVVFCNPRGSDGYGIDFREAVYKNWGHLAAADILTALDTALLRYSFLDEDRLFVTGGSYGGYMTAWLVTQVNRFKAAVSQRGVYEFIGFGMTTDIPIWFEKQYEGEILDRFADIWQDQPMAHVRNIKTPLLIIHSENDFRVPIVTAEQLFWLCKRYGKIVELVRYPRDGHELSRSGEPRHIIDRINRICNWFTKYDKS